MVIYGYSCWKSDNCKGSNGEEKKVGIAILKKNVYFSVNQNHFWVTNSILTTHKIRQILTESLSQIEKHWKLDKTKA